jgi:soluble lytic murein transglycosylase-like protein
MSDVNLRDLIYQESLAKGVPPEIALAVAQRESGISQWTQGGGLVTGTSGEIGVFQLMPKTALGLGVDPRDLSQNIAGGVSLLAQLFQKYGNWAQALSAYNSGNPNSSSPGVLQYVAAVLGMAGSPASAPSLPGVDLSIDGATASNGPLVLGAIAVGLGVAWWLLD